MLHSQPCAFVSSRYHDHIPYSPPPCAWLLQDVTCVSQLVASDVQFQLVLFDLRGLTPTQVDDQLEGMKSLPLSTRCSMVFVTDKHGPTMLHQLNLAEKQVPGGSYMQPVQVISDPASEVQYYAGAVCASKVGRPDVTSFTWCFTLPEDLLLRSLPTRFFYQPGPISRYGVDKLDTSMSFPLRQSHEDLSLEYCRWLVRHYSLPGANVLVVNCRTGIPLVAAAFEGEFLRESIWPHA